jgi:two-component system, response regulator YesN
MMIQLLLVDDEPVILKSLVNNDWAGVGIGTVHQAENGLVALEVLKRTEVDIVVTDIRMPGMDGLELCRCIREQYPLIKCILLSGYGEFEYARQAIQYGISSYLLKPVKDEDLLAQVGELVEAIRLEQAEKGTLEKTRRTLRTHLPMLRAGLLKELLAGPALPARERAARMEEYGMSFRPEVSCFMVLARLEGVFRQSGDRDLALYEYAVQNIAGELLESRCRVWSCKDTNDYLVFVLQPKEETEEAGVAASIAESAALELQEKVSDFLKGQVSVWVSGGFRLPEELADTYRAGLNEFRKVPRSGEGRLLRSGEQRSQSKSLQALHSPPGFQQLLEAGRYDDARFKLDQVFAEMEERRLDSEEHLMEIVYTLANAFLYLAHLQGKTLLEMSGWEAGLTADSGLFRHPGRVRGWALDALRNMEAASFRDLKDSKGQLIARIHRFIEAQIAGDVSLQTIADHVGLHPVYLSTLYKQEMKENISDFIIRYRMEKAGMLLRTTDIKIYELASRLGFQNPPYFSKLFKQHYGLTPQEFRNRLGL